MISEENLATVAVSLRRAGVHDGVFIGGAIVRLLLTDPLAPQARHTDDVDVVVRVTTRRAYDVIEHKMRSAGHSHALDGPICRWIVEGIKVDLMPTDEDILGFSNRWYQVLAEVADEHVLDDGTVLRVVSPPYLIATKLEAFRSRGNDDYMGSKDIEDIVLLLDGREELVAEIAAEDADLRSFISEEFRRLLGDQSFRVSLPAHMLPDEASQARVSLVLARMNEIAGMEV